MQSSNRFNNVTYRKHTPWRLSHIWNSTSSCNNSQLSDTYYCIVLFIFLHILSFPLPTRNFRLFRLLCNIITFNVSYRHCWDFDAPENQKAKGLTGSKKSNYESEKRNRPTTKHESDGPRVDFNLWHWPSLDFTIKTITPFITNVPEVLNIHVNKSNKIIYFLLKDFFFQPVKNLLLRRKMSFF